MKSHCKKLFEVTRWRIATTRLVTVATIWAPSAGYLHGSTTVSVRAFVERTTQQYETRKIGYLYAGAQRTVGRLTQTSPPATAAVRLAIERCNPCSRCPALPRPIGPAFQNKHFQVATRGQAENVNAVLPTSPRVVVSVAHNRPAARGVFLGPVRKSRAGPLKK